MVHSIFGYVSVDMCVGVVVVNILWKYKKLSGYDVFRGSFTAANVVLECA